MDDETIEPPSPCPPLERYKTAYSSFLTGEDSVGAELLEKLSMIDGIRRDWDYLRKALWNCTDRLPEEHWQRFQFAAENPHPVSYAYAVRMEEMGSLLMGFLETAKYDAVHNLFADLMHGLEGPP